MEKTEKRLEKRKEIVPQVIDEEMKRSYLAYSMSVIVSRALPDVRDGLKPVHRRILFAMHEMGLASNKSFKKSARIVGEVLGKYHPHGDSPVYEAMVRMAQEFSMRYMLVAGQGNFGSIDNDPPAAMRYTEARLDKKSEAMLEDLEKQTVPFGPNFDGSLEEPLVLPSKFPNLLVNGAAGIAVGMATNIPPHNLKEVTAACVFLLENPEASVFDLMRHIPGPDFPTGGIILGRSGIRNAYETGRGKILLRAKIETEEVKNRIKLIIREIPYQVSKADLVEEIANLVRDKVVVGITDIRDESDRDGIRVVLELKSGAVPDVTINQLFSHSRLQVTVGVINLSLVESRPRILSLKETIYEFLKHRKVIIIARCKFELAEAEAKAHILEGLLIALANLDGVVDLIRKSKDPAHAKVALIQKYKFSEKQAQAVLDMRLSRLTALESEEIKKEHAGLLELITRLKEILASEDKIKAIIKAELLDMGERFGDERKTQIAEGGLLDLEDEDLIPKEDCVVTLSQSGYAKRQPLALYKSQNRGGRGITASGAKEADVLTDVFVANTHVTLFVFTTRGKAHMLKTYRIPEAGRYSKGVSLANLVSLDSGESVTGIVPVTEFREDIFLTMVTKKGVIKKTSLAEFANERKGGKLAIGLDADDALVSAFVTQGDSLVLIATKNGMAVKFEEKNVRAMGRTAYGVRGVKLRQGDFVIGAVALSEGKNILTVTEKGYGKSSNSDAYRLVNRGGVGVINLRVTEKNGPVARVLVASQDDEVLLLSNKGILIRIKAGRIPLIGRNTQGVRLMRLEEGDILASASVVSGVETGETSDLPESDGTPLEESEPLPEENDDTETGDNDANTDSDK